MGWCPQNTNGRFVVYISDGILDKGDIWYDVDWYQAITYT
jgi:hypothetical protein